MKRLDITEKMIVMGFSELHQKRPFGLVDMVSEWEAPMQFAPDGSLRIPLSRMKVVERLRFAIKTLKEIALRVNG